MKTFVRGSSDRSMLNAERRRTALYAGSVWEFGQRLTFSVGYNNRTYATLALNDLTRRLRYVS